MTLVYLGCLLGSMAGIAVLDWRLTLALWAHPKRTLLGVGLAVALFVVWDIAGIMLGVFLHEPSRFASGILLGPQFPIEELVFLVFLSYLTLVLLGLWERLGTRPGANA